MCNILAVLVKFLNAICVKDCSVNPFACSLQITPWREKRQPGPPADGKHPKPQTKHK